MKRQVHAACTCRGQVLAIHTSDKGGPGIKAAVTCSSFHPNTTKFNTSGESDLSIAPNQIVKCSVIENSSTGTFAPCLLVELVDKDNDINHEDRLGQNQHRFYENQILCFCYEKEQFSIAGSFSTSTSLSKSNVWLLNGPTICWEHDGCLKIVTINPGSELTNVATKQLPTSLWTAEHTLKWCDIINGDLIILATGPQQDRNDNSSHSWFEFEEAILQRQWSLIKCPKRDFDKSHVVDCVIPMVPDVYAGIVKCLHVSGGSQAIIRDFAHLSESSILAATGESQLLEFFRGRVRLVCDLPFNDPCSILTVARMGGTDIVLVMAESGAVCAVERTTFKMLEEWSNISTVLVDDFLFNGSEQVLMIPSATSGDEDSKNNQLQHFILTDLESCFVNNKDKEADEVIDDTNQECGDNLLSAIQALEARLQSGMATLRADQTKCDEKSKLIVQSQHALHKMVNVQEENSMMGTLKSDLVCISEGSIQDRHYSYQDCVAIVTEDHVTLQVSNGWQRVVDMTWVVGVELRNNSHSAMKDISLSLVPANDDSNTAHLGLQQMTTEGKVMFPSGLTDILQATQWSLTDATKSIDPKEPELKRRKLNSNGGQIQERPVRLCPGEQVSVVAMTAVPEFAGYSIMCCDMVVQWRELDEGREIVAEIGDNKKIACMRERAKSCGRVWLSAADVVSGDLGVEIVSSSVKTAETLKQDIQALSANQISTALSVTSLHSNLSCIPQTLQGTMRFISTTLHDGLVCPAAGALWAVIVRLEMEDPCRGQINVWTRDKKQLMLLCHMLHQHLPEDVVFQALFPPASQMEQSISTSIQSMKQELSNQVVALQNIQITASMVQGQPSADSVVSQEGEPMDVDNCDAVGEGSKVAEKSRKMMDVQRNFEAEHLKPNSEILTADKERSRGMDIATNGNKQHTDGVMRELARNVELKLR